MLVFDRNSRPYLVGVAVEKVDAVPRVSGFALSHPPAGYATQAQTAARVTDHG